MENKDMRSGSQGAQGHKVVCYWIKWCLRGAILYASSWSSDKEESYDTLHECFEESEILILSQHNHNDVNVSLYVV